MADIELVIKISEEEYINIKNAINSLIENGVGRTSMSKVCLAILDGTPLPKGHGDLIDRKELLKQPMDNVFYPSNYVRTAPTIIEADKESEDKRMIQVLINLTESAYKEMCESGIDNVDYDIRQMMRDGTVINRNLCDSCVTKGCIFQSGMVRNHCDFYKSESEVRNDT